jgi:hypothetical protein
VGKSKFQFNAQEEDVDPSFSQLSKRLAENTRLREFFIGAIFSERFGTAKGLHEFVQSTSVFPAVYLKSSGHKVLDFFEKMRYDAGNVFERTLDKTFEDICEHACEVGVFAPQSYIVGQNGLISIIRSDSKNESTEQCGTFYEVSEALYESWVKATDRNKMLELWTHALLKEHLAKTDYTVLRNVTVVELLEGRLDLEKITDERTQKSVDVGKVNCLITSKKHRVPIGLIECTMDSNYGWTDVREFYGSMRLYNAQFGVVLIGREETFKSDRYHDNVAILPGILNRKDFPAKLFEWVDLNLKIGPLPS